MKDYRSINNYMKTEQNKIRMTFSVSSELEKLLREISKRTGLKMSTIVEKAVKEWKK